MDIEIIDDSGLLHLIVARKAEALGELYDRYGRLVFSLALNIVGESAIAEEITQDVFTSIWEKADTYREDQSKVSTWLSSITRHRSIDMLRRQSVRPEYHSVGWADAEGELVSPEDQISEVVELNIEQRKVREAIGELPAEQKQVLAMAFFQGYSHSEIASELGEPLGTIKTRIRLAMQKLRVTLFDVENRVDGNEPKK